MELFGYFLMLAIIIAIIYGLIVIGPIGWAILIVFLFCHT
jgi:hypothetical protein